MVAYVESAKKEPKGEEGERVSTPRKEIQVTLEKSSTLSEQSSSAQKNGFESENELSAEKNKNGISISDFEDSKEIQSKIEDQNKEIIQTKNLAHIASLRKKQNQQNNLTNLLNSVNLHEKGQFQDINIYEVLGSKISLLWKVWEIVLTNEPLLVIADSPTISR